MTAIDTVTQSRRFRLLIYGLTINTGLTDAVGFLGLGGAFTSVMTGNLVMTGLSIGTGDTHLLTLTVTALTSYVVGVVLGSLLVRRTHRAATGAAAGDAPHGWHRDVTLAIGVELAIFLVYGIGWELVAGRPTFLAQVLLLCNNAIALGIQAAAVQALGVRGLSTTFLTGTLTRVVLHAVEFKTVKGVGINIGTLVCLITGALLGGVGIALFRLGLPLMQVTLLGGILLASRALTRE